VEALYAPASGRSYGLGDEGLLAADLEAASEATAVVEAQRWEDLMMLPDGSLAGGGRFTQRGLEQVCEDLAPGLFRLMLDLSGDEAGPGDPASDFSAREAANLFNLVLRRRFGSRIRDRRRLVRDLAAGTVDGTAPAGGAFLPNREFLRRLQDQFRLAGRRVVLVGASTAGRRLSVRYADAKGLARDPGGAAWHGGVWACNSEASGDAPASASALVHEPRSGRTALGPPLGGRTPRSARGYGGAVDAAARAAAASSVDGRALAEAFRRLGARELVPAGRGEAAAAACGRAASALEARGVPARAAREAVLAARYGIPPGGPPGAAPPSDPGNVTGFGLYAALCSLAESRHHASRERLERAAYKLLFPNETRRK